MLTETVFNILFDVVSEFLLSLPSINFEIDTNLTNSFFNYISLAVYFFPWKSLIPILVLTGLLMSYRIIVTLVKTIVEIIPFV